MRLRIGNVIPSAARGRSVAGWGALGTALVSLVGASCQDADRDHEARELNPLPGISVGVEDGPEDQILSGVTDANLVASGILVSEVSPPRLREYDKSGQYIRTWSVQGEGPKELGAPLAIADCGDLIVVMDAGAGAFKRFRLGQFIDQVRSPVPLNGQAQFAGCAGRFLVMTSLKEQALASGRNELPRTLTVIDHATGHAEAEVELGSKAIHVTADGRYAPIPVMPERHVTVSGEQVLIVNGGTGAVEVRRLPDLSVLRGFWIGGLSRGTDTDGTRRLAGRRWAESLPHAQSVASAKQILERMPAYEDPLPLLDRIFSDAEGQLWVRTLDRRQGEHVIWGVVDPEGRVVRRVALDRRFEVKDVDNVILGLERDELGVERLRLIPVAPPSL